MANNECYSPDPHNDGIPEIPPAVIEAFKNKSFDLLDEMRDLNGNRAELARWLRASAEKNFHTPEQKRAYILGALSVFGLLKLNKEYTETFQLLERLYQNDSYIDEKHTEPPVAG